MLSSDDGDEAKLDSLGETCFARVDFISHALADELLALVGEWHAALPRCSSADTFFGKLERYDDGIARTIHLTIPCMLALVASAWLARLASYYPIDAEATIRALRDFSVSLLLSGTALFAISSLSKFLAGRAYKAVNSYGRRHPFKFTRGDDEVQKKIEKRDKHSVFKFWCASGLAILLNIAAGVVTWWLLPRR